MSRSASLVAAFLIATRNLSLDDALVLLRSKRPIVAPNRGFMEQLSVFEEHHARQWWPQSDRLRELNQLSLKR
jgi:protein-tyrosine phosphatase